MSGTGAEAADGGFLSIDEAIAQIDTKDKQKPEREQAETVEAAEDAPTAETDQAEEAEQNTEADTTAEDGSEDENPGDTEDAEGEDAAGTLKLQPPNWWNKEQKALFEALSPEVQAAVYAQEENREKSHQKAKAKLAEAEKASTEAAAKSATRLQVLDQILPQAMEMYGNRWANVDWAAAATQMEPADYNRVRAQYEQETTALHRLTEQKQQAESDRYAKFVREEGEKLREVAPDLADEKEGPARRQKLGEFLSKQGVSPDTLRWMSATEAALAYDAMQWRAAKANAKANPVPNKPAPQRVVAKPTATSQVRSPQSSRLKSLQAKFDANPSMENLIALEQAKGM